MCVECCMDFHVCFLLIFFIKQKTAYEVRISDWSSDVCSSDLGGVGSVNSRDWSRRYHDFIPNPYFNTDPALSNGLPANIGIDNVRTSYTPSGTIQVVHPLQGMQFDASGNLVPFQ